MNPLRRLEAEIAACRKCPRLVAWRERVASEKAPRYRGWDYWGRPLPGWGDPGSRVLAVGLAPAAHGGNRTGRMFTGDSSGDTLARALHAAGFANMPRSESREDGLRLRDIYITAAVRCAPPGNQPAPLEFRNCAGYLGREFALLGRVRVVVALGGQAFGAALRMLEEAGAPLGRPRPKFGHGTEHVFDVPGRGRVVLLGAYHPSRQNTNTGRLTQGMLDGVFRRARKLAK